MKKKQDTWYRATIWLILRYMFLTDDFIFILPMIGKVGFLKTIMVTTLT